MTRRGLRLVEPVEEVKPDPSEPSESFIRLTRNPDIKPPAKVVRTKKGEGDIVI